MRTELSNRMISSGTNALASSIILVCRPRSKDLPTVTRRDFLAALKDELPIALTHLQRGNIAPVDLAQASIGPGMAVFTRYGKVLDASGKALSVREALALINATLDEVLSEQEGDFDADTRWALAWFEQFGTGDGLPCTDRHHASFLYRLGKKSILIDCGEAIDRNYKASGLSYDLLDAIFISHLHSDHFGGTAALAKLLPIRHFYHRGIPASLNDEPKLYPQMMQAYKTVSRGKATILPKLPSETPRAIAGKR
jgi:hypothetical protein